MNYTETSASGKYAILYDQTKGTINRYFYMSLNSIFYYPDSLTFLTFSEESELAEKVDELKGTNGWYMREENRIKRVSR